ncbi:helix-turn-helix transcriptional regulator [Azospirillum sp. RWY-5-1]|uniref:Helix-turn-helix transcriptional regulator n=1 Tax=Azospirillum oleiclasticum TaxID=2735135 RepID=A0ABX2T7F5_9PROT|nr:helix-turn-helix domain-containing protein [Azospirillum oleiclasticum]NYZ13063.1 helix-turn-helix transcriptional regulator [Azospirillum oleiclasticum]NYZ20264.1 helix-turn-helix transcriptional regulator [Azospirillum oleiclasticum]
MTPFGEKVRSLRDAKGVTLKQMAADLSISSAYLSALEHGKRGQASPQLIRQICAYFGIIWDEAEDLERLAALSHPRVTVDTAGLTPKATELANRLAERIHTLDEAALDRLLAVLDEAAAARPGDRGRRVARRR